MKTLTIGDLKARIPIIQGGMGVGISLSGLASAVANEGGIGVISAAGLGLLYKKLSPSNYTEAGNLGLAEEIRKAREKAKGIIGVNVMVALSDFAELVKTSIAEKVDIIFSGAGLPLDLPSFLKKDSVTKLVPIVSSARAVRIICEKWKNNYDYLPDAVVLEGPKAGGHLGYKENQLEDQHFSLEELLPQVVEEVSHFEQKYDKKIPVIAAGGIYTGEDIKRMIDLGASGVQLGARLRCAPYECSVDAVFIIAHRAQLCNERAALFTDSCPFGNRFFAFFTRWPVTSPRRRRIPAACCPPAAAPAPAVPHAQSGGLSHPTARHCGLPA